MPKPAFRVLWTRVAHRDLESLIRYIAQDSSINAKKLLGQLQSKAESLRSVPERIRLVPELLKHGLGLWRELIVRPYRMIYRVDEQTVYVLAVLDSRRDLEDLLLERLVRE